MKHWKSLKSFIQSVQNLKLKFLGAIAPLIFLFGCGLIPKEGFKPNPKSVYEHDLSIEINDKEYVGSGVIPRAELYTVQVKPRGKVNKLMWNMCSRHNVINEPDKKDYVFQIRLFEGKEDNKLCKLKVTALEEKKKRNGFAQFVFEDPNATIPANIYCNGRAEQSTTTFCQNAAGLINWIEFGVPVVVNPSQPHCDVMRRKTFTSYEFYMPKGDCDFYFSDEVGNYHRLSTLGFDDIPPILED